MNKNIEYVINGFVNLNKAEQQEFLANIGIYLDSGQASQILQKKAINENVKKHIFGPLGSTCQCCGR